MKNRSYYVLIIIVLMMNALIANEITLSTPEGTISLQIKEGSLLNEGQINTENLIHNIAIKLEELDVNYLSKLNTLDKNLADKILADIFSMLNLIPSDIDITINQVPVAESMTNSGSSLYLRESGDLPPQIQDFKPAAKPVLLEPEPVNKTPMTSSDFRRFLNSVKSEKFSDAQLRVIRLGSREAWCTVGQIIQILNVLTYSEDKLLALEILYPRVTDPQNAHNITKAFNFASDKEEAEQIISK